MTPAERAALITTAAILAIFAIRPFLMHLAGRIRYNRTHRG